MSDKPSEPPAKPEAKGALGHEHSDVILERLLSLHPKVIDLSLERLERLLKALGHPERRLPPVIHVAGTNGKGSVCAFLAAGLTAAGARVSAYVSPHLVRFHERIRLPSGPIPEAQLAALLNECEAANAGAPITFFEITTAAAFLAFSRVEADWLVLEVGLGGRLDATNVVDAPVASVITPVSLDHQQFLGDTVAQIAREKAGILKPAAPCVVGRQTMEADQAISAVAERVGAPLSRIDEEWRVRMENGRLIFEDDHGLADLPKPRLAGAHQVENAGIALATLRILGLPAEALEKAEIGAMEEVVWPARLQRLQRGALSEISAERVELWLDGGHNPSAGAAAAAFMAEREEQQSQPLYLICGMLNTKDPGGFLTPFQGLARRVIGVPIPGEANALSAEDVATAALRAGLPAATAGSVESALRQILGEIENDYEEPTPRVLVCGSLYLAGRVLRENS